MVLPRSTSDVQALAEIISKYSCPFGIKAGAHSAWKGSNGIENGVTVDLGRSLGGLHPIVHANT